MKKTYTEEQRIAEKAYMKGIVKYLDNLFDDYEQGKISYKDYMDLFVRKGQEAQMYRVNNSNRNKVFEELNRTTSEAVAKFRKEKADE